MLSAIDWQQPPVELQNRLFWAYPQPTKVAQACWGGVPGRKWRWFSPTLGLRRYKGVSGRSPFPGAGSGLTLLTLAEGSGRRKQERQCVLKAPPRPVFKDQGSADLVWRTIRYLCVWLFSSVWPTHRSERIFRAWTGFLSRAPTVNATWVSDVRFLGALTVMKNCKAHS